MNHVWKFSQAANGDLLVLLAIADFANDAGDAWPSVATLAKKARLKIRQTQYSIRHLEASGELKVLSNKGPKGCHIYRVLLPHSPGAENAGVQNLQGAFCDTGGALHCTGGVHSTAPKPSENHQKEPSERERPLTLEAAVEIFEPMFPEKAVKASLSRMSKRFRRLLTHSSCTEWLAKEKEAARPKSPRQSTSASSQPAEGAEQLTEEEQRQMAQELARQRGIAGLRVESPSEEVTS